MTNSLHLDQRNLTPGGSAVDDTVLEMTHRSRTIALTIVIAALTASVVGSVETPAEPVVLTVAGGGELAGELVVRDADGAQLRRLVGLGNPISVSALPDAHYLVVDAELDRILEIDLDGAVHWSWDGRRLEIRPLTAVGLPSGNVLVAAGHQGAIELDRGGAVVWRSPESGFFVTSALRLPDASTLMSVKHRRHTLFRVAADRTDLSEIDFPYENQRGFWTRIAAVHEVAGEFLIWDQDWRFLYRAVFESGELSILARNELFRPVHVATDGGGGLIFSTDLDLAMTHRHAGGKLRRFDLLHAPTAVAPAPDPDDHVLAFRRTPDASWPESRPAAADPHPIRWPVLWAWLITGFVIALGLNLLAWQRAEPGPHSSTAGVEVEPSPRLPALTVRLGALASVVAGYALAARGMLALRSGSSSEWLPMLVAGVVLVVAVLEAWRRLVLRRRDPFWTATVHAAPRLAFPAGTEFASLLVAVGCVALFLAVRFELPATHQAGLWAMLLMITLGMATLSPTPPWRSRPPVDWRFWASLSLPLAVATVTLLYRLDDIPVYLHFDHVYYATAALDLVEGRFESIWDFGFVPAPLIGLVPSMLGLLLAGPGEVGFRLGSALYGLSGIVAIAILGRCYRDRRTGFIAAILLAGAVPFIHFSRTGAAGDATTTALWTLTLFVLAVRKGSPGLWILAGAASGYCFYLWPGARVVVVACALGGVVMGLRSPRAVTRRWYGPLLMMLAFAVWIAPLIPSWLDSPNKLFPRAEPSLEVYKPSRGFDADRFVESFGEPLERSFGWFFLTPDHSTHGTISPGCNSFEATLLAVGLVILLVEGFSVNVVLGIYLALVLLFMGAFGDSPPWYSRLVPSIPIAVLLMSRTLVGTLDLLAPSRARMRALGMVAATAIVLWMSPVANMLSYIYAEETGVGVHPLGPMTVVGRHIRDLGPSYHHYLVITENIEWSCDANRANGFFGVLLPYVWDLHVTEIRDLEARLPLPGEEAATLVLQTDRIDEDLASLRRWYPDAELELLYDRRGFRHAGIVVIEQADAERAASAEHDRDG
jgi:ADP-ribose pyrophosphatase YjhB (NUDIX family)